MAQNMSDPNWLSPYTNHVRPYQPIPTTEAGYRGIIIEQLSMAKQYLKQTTNDELNTYLYTLSQQLGISNKAEEANPTDPGFQAHEEFAAEDFRVVKIALERRSITAVEIDWQKIRDLLRFEKAKWILDQPDPDVLGQQQRDIDMSDAQ